MNNLMPRLLIVLILIFSGELIFAEGDLGYGGKKGKVFGYESVEEALETLKNDPNVEVSDSEGWTIISDEAGRALWSFAPLSHPAHPSVIKRSVVEKDGQIGIDTQVRCGAKKGVCDKLVQDFIELNNKVRKDINNESGN